MALTTRIRTAAWYGDRWLTLRFPVGWEVTSWWPETPGPLTDDEVADALERPVGQPPLRELARGRHRPVVIVDDLTRPTPVGRVLPFILRHLADAGIPPADVRVLIGTGTHRAPTPAAIAKKVGPEAASACRVLVHDYLRGLERIGRTSFGTPVIVNREVLASDLVLGIGGVYPQHSAGFGGGSKLALGVLGKRSIVALHYGHPSVEGSYAVHNDFRRDLDEIATMLGLDTSVALHVDANRDVVRVVSGDHRRWFEEAVAFATSTYRAPLPGDADVVISNAYPMDISLTFMRSKGVIPLLHARPGASRVVVAACSEGVGHHGLFPFVNGPRFHRQRHLARIVATTPSAVPLKGRRVAVRGLQSIARRINPAVTSIGSRQQVASPTNPIWLYVPMRPSSALPASLPGMTALYEWDDTIERIRQEQGDGRPLKVAVYPCSPLQVLDWGGRDERASEITGA
jgi:nickel-dependent lactate racemase